jgi:hypothetical protein
VWPLQSLRCCRQRLIIRPGSAVLHAQHGMMGLAAWRRTLNDKNCWCQLSGSWASVQGPNSNRYRGLHTWLEVAAAFQALDTGTTRDSCKLCSHGMRIRRGNARNCTEYALQLVPVETLDDVVHAVLL